MSNQIKVPLKTRLQAALAVIQGKSVIINYDVSLGDGGSITAQNKDNSWVIGCRIRAGQFPVRIDYEFPRLGFIPEFKPTTAWANTRSHFGGDACSPSHLHEN
jgi:hypothetical protein